MESEEIDKIKSMNQGIDCRKRTFQGNIDNKPEIVCTGKDELYTDFYKCPFCGYTALFDFSNYCPECGEKIYWVKYFIVNK